MIKLVAIDVDGTLLNSKLELTEATKQALKAFEQQGILFTICSGRSLDELAPVLRETTNFRYAILCNGAYIMDIHTNEVIYESTLTKEETLHFYHLLASRFDMLFEPTYHDAPVALRSQLDTLARYNLGPLGDLVCQSHHPVDDLVCHIRSSNINAGKINMFFLSTEQRDQALALLSSENYQYFHQHPRNLEINCPGVCKGNALSRLARILGYTSEEVMAIGDHNNDLTMIQYAGTAVAMENAIPIIRENADFITKSNDEDGVAYALHYFIG